MCRKSRVFGFSKFSRSNLSNEGCGQKNISAQQKLQKETNKKGRSRFVRAVTILSQVARESWPQARVKSTILVCANRPAVVAATTNNGDYGAAAASCRTRRKGRIQRRQSSRQGCHRIQDLRKQQPQQHHWRQRSSRRGEEGSQRRRSSGCKKSLRLRCRTPNLKRRSTAQTMVVAPLACTKNTIRTRRAKSNKVFNQQFI